MVWYNKKMDVNIYSLTSMYMGKDEQNNFNIKCGTL